MPFTTALALLAAAVPFPAGANSAPDFYTPAGHNITLRVCPHGALPTDVTVTDRRGRQYRTTRDARQWVDRRGKVIASRGRTRMTVSVPGYVFAWCD